MFRVRLVVGLVLLGAPAAAGQERELEVPAGDATLHVRVVGDERAADAVIVVHGGPGLTLDYMLPLSALAAPGRKIVFYDQRGSGRSMRPSTRDYSLGAQVADLDAVRRAVGVPRAHVLGHSWGTVVALAYAIAHPDKVASVILIGMGAPTASEDRRSFGYFFGERKALLLKSGLVSKNRPGPVGDDCMAGFSASLPVHFADARHPGAHRLAGSYHCDVARATVAAAGEWNFRHDLESFDTPLLLVIGDADSNYEGYRDTALLVPEAQLVRAELTSCGHFPWIECPVPFFAAVSRFLTQLRGD